MDTLPTKYRDPESETQSILASLLPIADSRASGLCVEAGAGTGNWYWQLFRQLGYPTCVIDAYPTHTLLTATEDYQIPLHAAALSDTNGIQTLYLGRDDDPNLCGLEPTAWGATEHTTQVSAITYAGLMRQYQPEAVTCLKLDIEGAEYRVINSLQSVERVYLPRVLCFEYGGGGARQECVHAWTALGLMKLDSIIDTLNALSYTQLLAIDSAQPNALVCLEADTIARQAVNVLFSDVAEWGNCIAVQNGISLGAYL